MIVYPDDHNVEMDAFARLRAACGFAELPPEALAAQVAGSRWIVAAYDDVRLVGFVRAISDGISNAYVKDVMVDPAYRRRGIGREMMRRLMSRREGIRWVLHTSEQAKAFYEAIGFSRAPDMLWCDRRAGR
jgi:ribosomal protein S18 acetylase RimI-like enzyme